MIKISKRFSQIECGLDSFILIMKVEGKFMEVYSSPFRTSLRIRNVQFCFNDVTNECIVNFIYYDIIKEALRIIKSERTKKEFNEKLIKSGIEILESELEGYS